MPSSKTLSGSGPTVKVAVEQDIIDQAQRRDSSHCMIADAIRTQVPEANSVSVDLATIRWTDRKKRRRYIYLTPPVAQLALVNFDQGLPSEPFEFTLRKAAQIVEVGRGKQGVSMAQQGVAGGGVPTRLGGREPAVGALAGSSPKRRRKPKAPAVDVASGEVGTQAEEGAPIEAAAPNPALVNRKGRIRAFGLRQIKS